MQEDQIEVEAEAGALYGFSVDGDAGFLLPIDPALPASEQRVAIRCDENSCQPNSVTLPPGRLTLAITSSGKKRVALGVFQFPPNVDRPPPLHFAPFLSGKQLLTTQTFRDLFRSEVIRGQEGLSVKDIALLFTDLKGSTALYDRIGDLNAFALVQQHFGRLQEATVRHNGAIIKTIGDAVMAAFLKPADAVQAALEMRKEIASFNERQPDKALILKIGVHKGAAIAVTLNDRLDYFGQTVNIAARVQNLADADEIFVSQSTRPRVCATNWRAIRSSRNQRSFEACGRNCRCFEWERPPQPLKTRGSRALKTSIRLWVIFDGFGRSCRRVDVRSCPQAPYRDRAKRLLSAKPP